MTASYINQSRWEKAGRPRLGTVCERFNWRYRAYCEMTNHCHFVVKTADTYLSKEMRQLKGVYTQRFNRHPRLVGDLFQCRFKAVLVERDAFS